jgi:hypothetical protein
MEIVKGIVEAVNVKEPREGKHGKFAGYGLKVNGEWHNGLCNERNGEVWPVDQNGNKFKEGQEVELLLEEKNGYKNIVTKTSKIIASGSSAQQASPAPVKTEERSAFPVTVWLNALDAAVRLANGITITVKTNDEDEVVKTTSQFVLRVADRFFTEALKANEKVN